MQNLTADLLKLTTRRDALITKQTAAQAAFDRALDARQNFMLTGDINDEQISSKRQAAVDSATSTLAGFELALAGMAAVITKAEGKLAAETLTVKQVKASEKLSGQTDVVEARHTEWLTTTREYIAALDAAGAVHYEIAQVGHFLRGICSEIEMAVDVGIPNLRASAINIAAGNMPIPREPAVADPIVTKPAPPTRLVFTWHAISWTDADSNKRVMAKWNEASLPLEAAAFALKTGLAIEPDDPRCKAQRGLGSRHPEPSWINDLDTKIGPNIPGSQQSTRVDDPAASFIKPRQANAPYVIKHREQAS
jgi:hypothetical protein